MSPGSRRVMPTNQLSNTNRRYLLHNILMLLHLKIKRSIIIRTSDLNQLIMKLSWHDGVVSLLYAPSVVRTIQFLFVRDPLVFSSVVKMCISCESVQLPNMKYDNGGNRSQSSSVAPLEKDEPRRATIGTGVGTNLLYDITSFQVK